MVVGTSQGMPNLNTKAESQTATETRRSQSKSASHQPGVLLLWIAIGVVAFHAAYAWSQSGLVIGLFLFALVQLAKTDSWRKTFYAGLAVGLLIAIGKLGLIRSCRIRQRAELPEIPILCHYALSKCASLVAL